MDAVSSSDVVSSAQFILCRMVGLLMNTELEMIWKEEVVA
jgi:hypothetical protein